MLYINIYVYLNHMVIEPLSKPYRVEEGQKDDLVRSRPFPHPNPQKRIV